MNLTTQQLAEALEEWAADVLSINTIEHDPQSIQELLPFVMSAIKRDKRSQSDPDLPQLSPFQQTLVRARRADLMFWVDPTDSWTATQTLYGYVDTLAQAIEKDNSLGGRVHTASVFYEASYDPPVAQHEDGTIARVATFTITVGELVKGVY